MKLLEFIKLMRPQQYIKNFFIFLPLFFALKITHTHLFGNLFVAFVSFSLTASAIYILNDYIDIEEDKKHPKKKNRPLASGTIKKYTAITLMSILTLAGFMMMFSLSLNATMILLTYVLLNIAYTFYLKHIAIVDVTIIAIGFVLRLFIGSAVTDTPLSMWIILMTFLLALFMALAKRRDDILIFLDSGKKMRKSIDGYNLQFLDTSMSIMASVVIVAYTIYTTSPEVIEKVHTQNLYLTTLFVILGIMRYLQIAFVLKDSGFPTMIVLKDKFIQLTLMGWILSFAGIIYQW